MTTPYLARGMNPVSWVTEGFPPVLLHVLAKNSGGLPPDVPALVHDQLAVRTPAEMRERIERRWYLLYSGLHNGELKKRADEIAVALVRPGNCTDPNCEDGDLRDERGTCVLCRPSRSEFNMRAEDIPDGRRSSPETVARAAASIRAQLRRTHGTSRSERSRHTLRDNLPAYQPAPYLLREPEEPAEDDIAQEPPAPRWRLREPEHHFAGQSTAPLTQEQRS
ncbi:hypothetical protein ACIRPK_20625 [Kitasatospora sp. NPDC101801]|uniref:hypothetical protein n=1 Tax=Kitasatospora sp. NPDC101801 TaxID=3364103 RepID=UPI003825A625